MRRNITQIHPCAKASWLSLHGVCKISTKNGTYDIVKVNLTEL